MEEKELMTKLKNKINNNEKLMDEDIKRKIIDTSTKIQGKLNFIIAIEELSELNVAIIEYIKNKEVTLNLIEEIADSEFIIKYIKDVLEIETDNKEYIYGIYNFIYINSTLQKSICKNLRGYGKGDLKERIEEFEFYIKKIKEELEIEHIYI